MNREIDHEFSSFRFADLQTFRNILLTMKIYKRQIPEVLEYITQKEQGMLQDCQTLHLCDECGGAMNLFEVNSNPRDQVGGDYKTQWWCGYCDNSIYMTETISEVEG
jgi:hypothetical protein